MLVLEKPVICKAIPHLANMNLRTLSTETLVRALQKTLSGNLWKTKEGHIVYIEDLKRNHLINIIKLLDNKLVEDYIKAMFDKEIGKEIRYWSKL